MTVGIYKITNLLNGKAYVGQSWHCEKRWIEHKSYARHNPTMLITRAMHKHNIENFKFEIILILDDDIDQETLNNNEISLITANQTLYPLGYNLTEGGSNGKMINIRRGKNHPRWGKKNSQKMRKKISKSLTGKTLSAEHKSRISEGNMGRKVSKTTRKKISKSQKGRSYEDVHGIKKAKKLKARLSKIKQGKNNNRYGTKHSKKTIIKMRKAAKLREERKRCHKI